MHRGPDASRTSTSRKEPNEVVAGAMVYLTMYACTSGLERFGIFASRASELRCSSPRRKTTSGRSSMPRTLTPTTEKNEVTMLPQTRHRGVSGRAGIAHHTLSFASEREYGHDTILVSPPTPSTTSSSLHYVSK